MISTGVDSWSDFDTFSGSDLSSSIGASHLNWQFEPTDSKALTGKVTSRSIGPLRVAWVDLSLGLKCWSGRRTQAEIYSNPEPYLTVVMPLAGEIALHSSDRTISVQKQELAIWDSRQSLAFEIIGGHYEQISVLVPQRILKTPPDACAALHCARVDKTNILSELCIQHMTTLAQFLDSQLRPYEISLSTVTTSLFESIISSVYKAPRDREILISEIKNYVECYIGDTSLSPATIAAAFEISTRYLHKIFQPDECSIGEWILKRRLTRSADDIRDNGISITDTAFKWGFKDLGHYSRTFKAQFGVSPSTFRKTALISSA